MSGKAKAKPRTRKGAAAETVAVAADGQVAAPFVALEIEGVAPAMWANHAGLWLEPELTGVAPGWSGLSVERRNRAAGADFAPLDTAPLARVAAREAGSEAAAPEVRPTISGSDNGVLGWDPRAAVRVRKEEAA